jgi:hypothetical protein
MSVKVANSRFIVSSVTGFYQQLFRRVSSFQELGDSLVREAERAQAFRQIDKLKDLGNMLVRLPSPEHSVIGQYYLTWCEYRNGENVQNKLERIIEQTQTYKPKVLFSLAALMTNNGDVETGARHYLEALKLADSPSTFVGAVKGMAILKSMEGFKVSALKDLESLASIVKYANPKTYYDYLNSLAVEVSEAGRNDEAQKISNFVLASPFINAYPEYRETGKDIALRGYKSRSSVRIIQTFPGNIVQMTEREPSDTSIHSRIFGPAPIVSLKGWKEEKMVKEPNGNDEELPEDMSVQQMAMKIIELITKNKEDEGKLRDLLDHALKLYSKK